MTNLLPSVFHSKLDYDIQLGDDNLKVTVIRNQGALLSQKLSEMNSALTEKKRVVGFSRQIGDDYKWLTLCITKQCLMIDMRTDCYTHSLEKFLADSTICFVALTHEEVLRVTKTNDCTSSMEIGFLGAQVLKKPEMRSYNLEQMGALVGVKVKPKLLTLTPEDLKDVMCLSAEQMKCAIHEAYYSFAIAYKLLVG